MFCDFCLQTRTILLLTISLIFPLFSPSSLWFFWFSACITATTSLSSLRLRRQFLSLCYREVWIFCNDSAGYYCICLIIFVAIISMVITWVCVCVRGIFCRLSLFECRAEARDAESADGRPRNLCRPLEVPTHHPATSWKATLRDQSLKESSS